MTLRPIFLSKGLKGTSFKLPENSAVEMDLLTSLVTTGVRSVANSLTKLIGRGSSSQGFDGAYLIMLVMVSVFTSLNELYTSYQLYTDPQCILDQLDYSVLVPSFS